MKKKLFVWDFHGTLEQGNEMAVLEMSNKILEDLGYRERFTESDCLKLYGKKWYEYFEYLLPKLGHSKHIELQEASFVFSINNPQIIVKYIKPSKNAHVVLEKISNNNDQILISNTKPESIKIFMRSIKVDRFFPEGKYFAVDSHSTFKSKTEVLRNYLENSGLVYDKIIVIGDSDGDLALARDVNAIPILYTHEGNKHKAESEFMINDLIKVLDFIN